MRFVHRWWVLVLLAAPLKARAQEAVPVHREPRHRLVLDSVRFRVLEVRVAPGDTTLFHTHDTTVLYVDLARSPVALQILGGDWSVGPPDPPQWTAGNVRIDSSYVLQPVTHRVTNLGGGMFRLLAITSSGPAARRRADTTQALPGTIELRSTWFRQSRVEVLPGATTAWRTSERPVLVVQPVATGLEVEIEGAARRRLDGPGSWILVPSRSRYRLGNAGTESIAALAIQIR